MSCGAVWCSLLTHTADLMEIPFHFRRVFFLLSYSGYSVEALRRLFSLHTCIIYLFRSRLLLLFCFCFCFCFALRNKIIWSRCKYIHPSISISLLHTDTRTGKEYVAYSMCVCVCLSVWEKKQQLNLCLRFGLLNNKKLIVNKKQNN